MKKKFSKILGVGLTLALLASLLLTAAPVLADVSEALVDLSDDEISADNIWTITFTVVDALTTADDIIIIWPDGFDITPIDEATADDDTDTVVTDDPDDDLRVGSSSGIGVPALVSTSTTGVFSTTEVTDDTLTIAVPGNIGAGATIQVVVGSATDPALIGSNADDTGIYNLIVYTSVEDDEVDSEDFELVVPEPDVPAGVVKLYNPSDILMDNFTGPTAIQQAIDDARTDTGFTIKVGEGTYASAVDVDLDAEVTIEASGDVDDTIIEGAVTISVAEIVLDGFTIDGSVTVADGGDESVLENLVFEGGSTLTIADAADDVEVTDCTFDVEDSLGIDMNEDAAVTGCTFTVEDGGLAIDVDATADGGTIEDNTFTGDSGEGDGIVLAGDADVIDNTFDDLAGAIGIDSDEVTIDGNTFKNLEEAAIIVTGVADGDTDGVTFLHIVNNVFNGNDADVLLDVNANSELVFFMFNTITDSDGDEGVLITNDGGADLSAANNWWSDAAGPAEGDDAFGGADDTVSEPYLPGAVAAGSALDTVTADLDESDGDAGVSVEVTTGVGTMDLVGVAQYTVNPVAAIGNAVGFWDVAVIGTTGVVDEITVRIYTDVTEDTELWVWGEARGEWLESEDAISNLFAGFIGVEIDATSIPTIEDLEALPFAVIEPPADAGELDAITIDAPASGASDVSLTPTFAWGAVEDADGYYFEFADNANFVLPLAKLDGDTGRLIVTAYAYVGELPYSTPYYWRVKAVGGTIAGGDLVESDWASAVFITMDEPEEPIPPVVIEEAPELPDIIITQPDIIVESPDIIVPLPAVVETPITPSWIYVIIGVGAVLVIALLVLIVRTRRVA